MKKKRERREQPLSTFDELLDDFGMELIDKPDPEGTYIPLIDDNGNLVKLKLDNITMEEIVK